LTFPTTISVPNFAVLHKRELKVLFNDLRWDRAAQVFMLLVLHSDFNTGAIPVTSYARLIDLCTPPSREKGGRAKGPTIKQMRYVIEQLIVCGLVKRNAEKNAAQGELRLYVRKRKLPSTK